MSSETVRARLAQLLRKSQKAVSLYSLSSTAKDGGVNERRFSAAQVKMWRRVNEELCQALQISLRKRPTRAVVQGAYEHRDALYGQWRRLQSELFVKREQLLESVEENHFTRAALLAERLVTLKARMQATRAALHELGVALADSAYSLEEDFPQQPMRDASMRGVSEPPAEELDNTNVIPFDAPRRSRL